MSATSPLLSSEPSTQRYGSNDAEIDAAYRSVVAAFKSGKSKPYEFRAAQLRALRRFLVENEAAIAEAVHRDLRRSKFEGVVCEVLPAIAEIDHCLSHLKGWMQPETTALPALFVPGTSQIVREPFGVALVLGAFNYPVTLTISPLLGAISAGNCAIIKPSEMSCAVEQLLATLLPQYLDRDCFAVICGDVPTTTHLLSLRWDKIFFTGSTRVGRIVMQAAAVHLTPVSLELGGKSPTIIDEHVGDLDVAVNRVLWGKCVNAGQTCIAPDYVFCHEKHIEAFLSKMKQRIAQFYGDNPQQSEDLSRIVTTSHFKRLKAMLDESRDCVFCGGESDEADKYIAPTLLLSPPRDSSVMREEIFGPLLPVYPYRSLDEVVDFVNSGEKPLTLYVFTRNSNVVQRLLREVSSGSLVQNDCLFQFANVHAPFGGVGHSGMGGYHGKYSFDCFSHKRSVLLRDDHALLDVPIRYPPYSDGALRVLRALAGAPDLPACLYKPWRFLGGVIAVGIVALAVTSLALRGPPSQWF